MVIMILENVPASLRGELSRWLFEISNGVYLGHVNAMVRDQIWERCIKARRVGSVFQAWSTNNEQHFAMRQNGNKKCTIIDMEGLFFIKKFGHSLTPEQKRRIEKR